MQVAAFEIDLSGLDETEALLAKIEASGRDLAEIAAQTAREQTLRRFDTTKSAPGGEPWAPWSERYARRMRDSGFSLLVRSGALRNSVYGYAVSDREAVVGTNVFYGAYHQTGTKKMPPRPFLGIDAENEREIVERIDAYLADALGGGVS